MPLLYQPIAAPFFFFASPSPLRFLFDCSLLDPHFFADRVPCKWFWTQSRMKALSACIQGWARASWASLSLMGAYLKWSFYHSFTVPWFDCLPYIPGVWWEDTPQGELSSFRSGRSDDPSSYRVLLSLSQFIEESSTSSRGALVRLRITYEHPAYDIAWFKLCISRTFLGFHTDLVFHFQRIRDCLTFKLKTDNDHPYRVYYYFYERSRASILNSRPGTKALSTVESIIAGLIAGESSWLNYV